MVGHRALVFPHDCLGILVVDAVLLGYIVDTASVLLDGEPNQGLFGQVVDFLISALLDCLGLVRCLLSTNALFVIGGDYFTSLLFHAIIKFDSIALT